MAKQLSEDVKSFLAVLVPNKTVRDSIESLILEHGMISNQVVDCISSNQRFFPVSEVPITSDPRTWPIHPGTYRGLKLLSCGWSAKEIMDKVRSETK